MPAGGRPEGSEVYIECSVHGGLLKVAAVCAVTGTEVSVFGPVNARQTLIRNAAAKLAYVLKKKAE